MHPIFNSNKSFLAVSIFWLAISAFVAMLLVELLKNTDISNIYGQTFSLVMPWYFVFVFVCFSNFYICQWLDLEKTNVLVVIGGHWASTAVSVSLWLLLGYLWAGELIHFGFADGKNIFLESFVANWILGVVLYLSWVLVHYVYLNALSREQQKADRLQQELLIKEIEFKSVKAAIHPHFMYNCLNMLANLSLTAPEKIHNICVKLAEFLRYSVNYSRKESVTIADEIAHIKNYLSIEQERFGDHLQVKFEVDDQLQDIAVMPLTLFPLVENSVKHGIDSQTDAGFIRVQVSQQPRGPGIVIENSYDQSGQKAQSTGLGLASLKKRLGNFYGGEANMEVTRGTGVFKVEIQLPRSDSNELPANA